MGIGPYGSACRGGRPCPPSPGNATLCRAGPVCPAAGAGKESPSHGFAVPAPFRQGGQGDGGCGLPRAQGTLAMTEAERICMSFRDQSADWSWESVIPLCKGRRERIATASDIGHWFRNDMGFTWSTVFIGRHAAPTKGYHGVRRGGALPLPRATARVAPTEISEHLRRAASPTPRPGLYRTSC